MGIFDRFFGWVRSDFVKEPVPTSFESSPAPQFGQVTDYTVREDWYRAIAAIRNESVSSPLYRAEWLNLKNLPNFRRVSRELDAINDRIYRRSSEMLNGLRSEESFQNLFTRWHSAGMLTELLKEIKELARHYNAVNWKMHAVRGELIKQDKARTYHLIEAFRDDYKKIVIFNNNWVKKAIKPLLNGTIKRFKL